MPEEGTPRLWRLWIDTGGTFTDCLAESPQGERWRAKVLSSSALRATVVAAEGARRVRLAPFSRTLPDDFLRGFELRWLGAEGGARVRRHAAASGWLDLDGDLPAPPGDLIGAASAVELSSDEEAPLLAARWVTGTPRDEPLPAMNLRLATTRGTNALLERRGARTAFFVTVGFTDLLTIGDQQRPELFALEVRKAEPLYETAVAVSARCSAAGEILVPLDEEQVRRDVAVLIAAGFESAAVALLHSDRFPDGEDRVAELLRKAGLRHVSASADLTPRIGWLRRAETAVVDAYLAPVIDDYLDRVAQALGAASRLEVMTSAGGLVPRRDYRPKDSLLSGPAGGVVGALRSGRLAGFERIISFDMGGTSTDVARCDGELEYRFEQRVGEARLAAPALAIETVAAGGGSICRFDGVALVVGPESAGARPGPACYGAGGPLTVTDVNLLLGRLDPDRFGIPVDPAAARQACDRLLSEVAAGLGSTPSEDDLLLGLLAIADERMAEAIRRISVRLGSDPADFALVAFGGAGGQHACSVAGLLGISRVVMPRDAGLLSALGLEAARIERFASRQLLARLDECGANLPAFFDELTAEARQAVVAASSAAAEGALEAGDVEIRQRVATLRFAGQESTLAVPFAGTGELLANAFLAAYRGRYGYHPENRPLEVVELRVIASQPPATGRGPGQRQVAIADGNPVGRRSALFGEAGAGRWLESPVWERRALAGEHVISGPALVVEEHSTTVVAVGWSCRADASGALILSREEG
ncbi:MAG: hydantoinase/oxoprolinase family protein [Acidobacteriota bacterium]